MTLRRRVLRAALVASLAAAAAGCSDPQETAREHLAAGNAFFAEQRYPEAVIEYMNALRYDDRLGEARFQLGQCYEKSGNPERAFGEYVRAADLMPLDARAQLTAASYLIVAQQYVDARTRIEGVIEADPTNVEAQILLGNALAGLRDLEGAVRQIEEAIALDPSRGLSYTELGIVKGGLGKLDEARAAFKKAIALDQASVRARLAFANFLLALGEVGEGETVLKEGLALGPSDPTANRMAAAFYVSTGRAAEAEPFFRAVANHDGSSAARLALADYYARVSRPDDARAVLEPLAKQPATFAEASVRLAELDYVRGLVETAHATLDEVLRREPNNARALLTRAQWMLSEGKPALALGPARLAVTTDRRSALAHYVLGLALAGSGRVEEALGAFSHVLELNPRAAAAQVQMSRLQLVRGGTDSAIQLAEQALRNAPGDVDARLALVRGLIARRDTRRAAIETGTLLRDYPNDPRVHAVRGSLLLMDDDRSRARQAFDRATDLDPASLEALTGLTAIDLSEGRAERAQARVDARVEVEPDRAALRVLSARLQIARREFVAAEQSLDRAIALDPADPVSYALLGQVLLARNRIDAATAEFRTKASAEPGNIATYTMLAMLHDHAQEREQAKRAYEKVLELDANAAVAANNLAWIYAEEGGDLDRALRLAESAAAAMPRRPEGQDTLGWVYLKKNLPRLAVRPFEQAVLRDPENPTYRYHLALALSQAGEPGRARNALALALKTRPDYPEAQQLLATLAGAGGGR